MYYNDQTIIYWQGEFVKALEAKANLYDQSLHYGYAVFEGIRAYETADGISIFKAQEHYDRLEYSAHAIGMPFPFKTGELIDLTYQLLEKNKFRNAYIRPLVSCPPNMSLTKGKSAQLLIAAWEWEAYLGAKLLRLKTSAYRRITPACFQVAAKVSGHYVNSILATQEAKDAGYDEALLLDVDGFVAEGPGSNFFIQKDQVLYTPQLGSILPGITRATLLEISKDLGIKVVEKKLPPEEVAAADSAFLCGTAAEVIGVESLDGNRFPLPWSASLGAVLQKAYKKKVLNKEYRSIGSLA
ncbi:MAG TPA: branched-chain amino acid transaminase [Flavisolibacter sp.]|jgi:branched-chain amino acid aminotransferase|nr:branched-chain amino acid transaminase [Flavisolibacter sp.]